MVQIFDGLNVTQHNYETYEEANSVIHDPEYANYVVGMINL